MGSLVTSSRAHVWAGKLKYHGLVCSRKLQAGDWFGLLAGKATEFPKKLFWLAKCGCPL